ncbi:MAG: hypothetical protein NC347_12820 [Clostridium sp.]|nr:hypothetical protein [Clostridium sp.]
MKKPVDYLYLKSSPGKSKRICVKEYQVAGIKVLEVYSAVSNAWQDEKNRSGVRKFRRWKRKFNRVLSSYEVSSCAMNGDEQVMESLRIENPGFLARKNELFLYGTYIFEHLALRKMKGGREKLLIYLESENWKSQEIKDLLWMAKDYYEDIVLAGQNTSAYEDVLTRIFEDCGLVVSIVDFKHAKMQTYDGAFFLVEKWHDSYMEKICFRRAYVVAEHEESGAVCRKVARETVTEQPVCFSGLCYERNGKKIPYPMAVDLYFQNPVFCDKKDISFVAIYRLECYNNNNSIM